MGATLKSNVPGIVKRLRANATRVVRETAAAIETDVKTGMAEPKSGRKYARGEKLHTASAPGESPAIDTSVLVNSVQNLPFDETTSIVGSNGEHAPVMELGGAHVEPRPFLGPAFERAQGEFERGLKGIFEG